MKRTISILAVFVSLFAGSMFFYAPKVYAAPVCYVAVDAETIRGADCADYEGLNVEALLGEPMLDGNCYIWGGPAGVNKFAIDSPECKRYELQGVGAAFTPPKCYKYDGQAYGVYSGFDVTKLTTVDCSSVEGQIKQEYSLTELAQNTCYVIGSDNDITIPGCERLERNIESGNEAALNPEREEVTNCDGRPDGGNPQDCFETNPIVRLILTFINFLSIGIGVIVTLVIIVGGIQYMTAGPNPQAVSAAKKRITNAIIALVAYFLLYAFLQWAVPGGVL